MTQNEILIRLEDSILQKLPISIRYRHAPNIRYTDILVGFAGSMCEVGIISRDIEISFSEPWRYNREVYLFLSRIDICEILTLAEYDHFAIENSLPSVSSSHNQTVPNSSPKFTITSTSHYKYSS